MDPDETVESITGETPEKVCPACEEFLSNCTCEEDEEEEELEEDDDDDDDEEDEEDEDDEDGTCSRCGRDESDCWCD